MSKNKVPSELTGISAFGSAYGAMLERTPCPFESIDYQLVLRMTRISENAIPHLYRPPLTRTSGYTNGSRPMLERIIASLKENTENNRTIIEHIARWTGTLAQKPPPPIESRLFGGTEEDLIERGTDWCTEIARIGCTLYQVAGFPARMVYLFDLNSAYSAHAIVEVYSFGRWGAVDTTSGVVYTRTEKGEADLKPASTWELMNDKALLLNHRKKEAACTLCGLFSAAGISEYPIPAASTFNYPISPINSYYQSILTMAEKGWPGGLYWLHGEDAQTIDH